MKIILSVLGWMLLTGVALIIGLVGIWAFPHRCTKGCGESPEVR